MEETGKKAETKSKKLAKTKKKSMPSVKERVVAFWKGVKAEFRIRFFDIACQYVVEFIR